MGNERELWYVMRAKTAAPGLMSEDEKPFSGSSFLNAILARIVSMFLEALETLLGKKLFTKGFGDELDYIEPKILRFVLRLVDENIIRSMSFKYPIPDWPKVICAHLSLEPITVPSGIPREISGSVGDGAAFDHNTAATKALAECLERYSVCNYDPNGLIRGSFSELKNKGALDPNLFKAFSDKQLKDPVYYKNHYFDHSTRFSWTRAISFIDEKQFFVPAQLVFLLYETLEGEPIIRGMTTSGAAAGSSREMAAYNAICEAIERDSFMIFWLNKLTSPVIDLSDTDKSITGDVSLFSQKIINESLSIASQIALYAAISRLLPAAAPLVVIPRIIGSPSNVSYSKNTSWAGTKNCFSSIKEIARVQLNLVEWSK